MTTIKCKCPKCIQNDNGHWWCLRFSDFTDKENVELCCKQRKKAVAFLCLQLKHFTIMSKQRQEFLTFEEMREVQNAWAMIARKFETRNEERRVA